MKRLEIVEKEAYEEYYLPSVFLSGGLAYCSCHFGACCSNFVASRFYCCVICKMSYDYWIKVFGSPWQQEPFSATVLMTEGLLAIL